MIEMVVYCNNPNLWATESKYTGVDLSPRNSQSASKIADWRVEIFISLAIFQS